MTADAYIGYGNRDNVACTVWEYGASDVAGIPSGGSGLP